MHPDKSAAVIGLLDLRSGITPEDFEKALEELDVDKVLDANRTARVSEWLPNATSTSVGDHDRITPSARRAAAICLWFFK